MTADFLGTGWKFPLALEAGAIARSGDEASIEESIWLILATAKGERVMRPDFGCGIHDLVFSLNNATTAGRIVEEVTDALVLFEPRIDVLSADVTSAADAPERLMIAIQYQVRATNSVFNMVYPFYLDRATG